MVGKTSLGTLGNVMMWNGVNVQQSCDLWHEIGLDYLEVIKSVNGKESIKSLKATKF